MSDTKNEHQEIPTREVDRIWREGERRGLSRRTFLQLLSTGGVGAVLAACEGAEQSATLDLADQGAVWVKDPAPFIRHPTNLETRLEHLDGFLTPNSHFFVRNHAPTPRIDLVTYRLRIEGDGIETPLELAYDDLLRLPTQSTIAYLECAGNWRSFFDKVLGQVASGGQWGAGAVGCATWTGATLGSVLELAGLRSSAVDVNLIGLDDGEFNRPMPLDRALANDTILAYAMNGETLPPDHGFPVRGVVPGWVGSSSVKWVGKIVVSSERIWTKNNTTSYVLIGPDWPEEQYAPAEGGSITTLNVKSALALSWPASVSAGEQRLRGFAHSPHGRIRSVQWNVDDTGWSDARLVDPALPRAWARFELSWNATPGSHTIRTRATDDRGNTQPDRVPFNRKGYLLNIPLPHPVEVRA